MPGNIGLPEIAIVLIIALIVFGFKGSIGGDHDDENREKPKIEATSSTETPNDQPAEVEVVRNKSS
jgi:hypothetical protein